MSSAAAAQLALRCSQNAAPYLRNAASYRAIRCSGTERSSLSATKTGGRKSSSASCSEPNSRPRSSFRPSSMCEAISSLVNACSSGVRRKRSTSFCVRPDGSIRMSDAGQYPL